MVLSNHDVIAVWSFDKPLRKKVAVVYVPHHQKHSIEESHIPAYPFKMPQQK
jgi:hypothetical protein